MVVYDFWLRLRNGNAIMKEKIIYETEGCLCVRRK